MIDIYSRLEPNKLLHTIYRIGNLSSDREDFTSEDKYLQGAAIKFDSGKKFKAHKHILCERTTDITQETWIVIKGSVLVKYYDTDGKYIQEEIIKDGDCTMTFAGGHSFEGLEDDTLVYEFKMGPYYGRDADKEFINED